MTYTSVTNASPNLFWQHLLTHNIRPITILVPDWVALFSKWLYVVSDCITNITPYSAMSSMVFGGTGSMLYMMLLTIYGHCPYIWPTLLSQMPVPTCSDSIYSQHTATYYIRPWQVSPQLGHRAWTIHEQYVSRRRTVVASFMTTSLILVEIF